MCLNEFGVYALLEQLAVLPVWSFGGAQTHKTGGGHTHVNTSIFGQAYILADTSYRL